jgi:hypothetical protein
MKVIARASKVENKGTYAGTLLFRQQKLVGPTGGCDQQ